MSTLFIAWTTVENLPDAEKIAKLSVESGLVACVQIDGPIRSFYHWENQLCESTEYRLSFKFLDKHHQALTEWVHHHHPYEVPEWIVVHADNIGEKYLSWSRQSSNSQPF